MSEAGAQLLGAQLAVLQILLHQVVVRLGDGVGQQGLGVLRLGGDLAGDVVGQRAGDALERGALADGQRVGNGQLLAVGVLDGVEDLGRAHLVAVAAVDEDHAGHGALTRLFPGADGARADAQRGVDDQHHEIRDVDGVHRLAAEVGVAGGVGDEEVTVLPRAVEQGGVDGRLALLLLLLEVGDAGAIVDAASAADGATLEQKQIGKRGLAGAGMSC